MANRNTSLIRYALIPGVGWRRGTLVTAKNGRIKPDWMVYNKQEVHCPNGKYEIRTYEGSKAIHKPVGSDLDVAQTAYQQFTKKLQYAQLQTELGIKMPDAPKAERKTIQSQIEPFIEKYARGSDDTIYNYTFVSTEFSKLLTEREVLYPEQVTEDDVIAFDRHLEELGNAKRTRCNRYVTLRCFLKYLGLDSNTVVSPEWNIKLKKYPKTLPVTYTQAQLDALYAASSAYHCLAWRCYRMLGFRDEELAFLEWSNLDFDHIDKETGLSTPIAMVRFKPVGSYPWNPELEWKPKDSEERDVPIPAVLLEELKVWRKRNPDTRFVMGTRNDRPNIKFLKALKSDWRAAGLNCGKCAGCLSKANECSHAKLKTFRATYLTTMLEHCKSSRDVQALAGHSSLSTTEKYLRPSAMCSLQKACNAAFD